MLAEAQVVGTQADAPPRRRPGPRWKGRSNWALTFVSDVPQLDPGLRRAGADFQDMKAFPNSSPAGRGRDAEGGER